MILPELEPIVKKHAEQAGLCWQDLAALVDVESSGGRDNNPRVEARIKDISLGPCQVLSATAAWLLETDKIHDPEVVARLHSGIESAAFQGIRGIWRVMEEVDSGIGIGAAYLKWQLDRYGNIVDAVAAYNAGSVIRRGDGYVNQHYVDKWAAAREAYHAEDEDLDDRSSGPPVPSAW